MQIFMCALSGGKILNFHLIIQNSAMYPTLISLRTIVYHAFKFSSVKLTLAEHLLCQHGTLVLRTLDALVTVFNGHSQEDTQHTISFPLFLS